MVTTSPTFLKPSIDLNSQTRMTTKAKQLAKTLRYEVQHDNTQWSLLSNKENVVIMKPSKEDDKMNRICGITTVRMSLEDVMKIMVSSTSTSRTMLASQEVLMPEHSLDGKVVHTYDDEGKGHLSIKWVAMKKAGTMSSATDFCLLEYATVVSRTSTIGTGTEKVGIVMYESIDEAAVPHLRASHDLKRSFLTKCGYIFTEKGENVVEAIFVGTILRTGNAFQQRANRKLLLQFAQSVGRIARLQTVGLANERTVLNAVANEKTSSDLDTASKEAASAAIANERASLALDAATRKAESAAIDNEKASAALALANEKASAALALANEKASAALALANEEASAALSLANEKALALANEKSATGCAICCAIFTFPQECHGCQNLVCENCINAVQLCTKCSSTANEMPSSPVNEMAALTPISSNENPSIFQDSPDSLIQNSTGKVSDETGVAWLKQLADQDPAQKEIVHDFLNALNGLPPAIAPSSSHLTSKTSPMGPKADEVYDLLCELASTALNCSFAIVCLQDENHQYFKSKIKINSDDVPSDFSICNLPAIREEPIMVMNALFDSELCDHPFVSGKLAVRFYAGVPLYSTEGNVVGTVCVMDTEPRNSIPIKELSLLEKLGHMAMVSMTAVTDVAAVRPPEVSDFDLKRMQDLLKQSQATGEAVRQHKI